MIRFLPFKYKRIGIVAVSVAVLLSGIYFFYELKIEVPVLAVASSYLDTKFFTSFYTNVIEELILLLFLIGFSLIVFTEIRNEKHWVKNVRIRALWYTIISYLIWLAFTTIFIFGSAYISALIINTILPFIVYIAVFYFIYYKTCRRRKIKILQQKLFKSQARN